MVASDEDLVARAVASHDDRAFEELVGRHQDLIRGWLRQLTGDAVRADDLAQDTFIRAWEKLSTFAGRGKFSSWLMKIAYNTFLQECRGVKRNQRLRDAVETDYAAQRASPKLSPQSELPDLQKMLAVLSDEERLAMLLCHAYGCSHGEARDVTGMPLGTIKSHIRRGKQKIRERFQIGE